MAVYLDAKPYKALEHKNPTGAGGLEVDRGPAGRLCITHFTTSKPYKSLKNPIKPYQHGRP